MKNTDYNVALNHLRVLLVRASAVKTHRRLLLVLLFSFIAIAQPSTVRAETITISNNLKETVKVCVYRSSDPVMVVALQCWTLVAGNWKNWARPEDVSSFNVIVYRPGVLDVVLCVAKNMSKGDVFVTSPCKIVTSDPRPKPAPKPAPATPKPAPAPAKNYTLRVCNTTGATVQFALAYRILTNVSDNYVAEGWWLVSKESCMNIEMNEVWKPQGVKDGTFAQTFIYGKSGRFFKEIWEGGITDGKFCINQRKAFAIRQYEGKNDKQLRIACIGENLEMVKFRKVLNREAEETYFFTF